jgi:hypothetical protein
MTEQIVTSELLNGSAAPVVPAAPAAPVYRPEGFPVTPAAFDASEAVSARAEIDSLKGDRDFYQALKAEKERGISGPASQRWQGLHAKGYPASTQVGSQADVDSQASARVEKEWSSFFSGLGQQWAVTPEQIAEIRGGVVREEIRNYAIQQIELMQKDKTFYRRLLDGDMAAKEKWGRMVAIKGLRPVKGAA